MRAVACVVGLKGAAAADAVAAGFLFGALLLAAAAATVAGEQVRPSRRQYSN